MLELRVRQVRDWKLLVKNREVAAAEKAHKWWPQLLAL